MKNIKTKINHLIILGLVGLIMPVGVEASTPKETHSPEMRSEPTVISLDLGEFLGNVIQIIQVSNISTEEEVAIGKQINQKLLSQQYQLLNNSAVQSYVDNLGQELVASSDRRDLPYTFQVVVSDQVNAFATPGGFIYVTTGLLKEADNRAQLASVIAHEIAHINQRHSIKALRRAVLAQGIAETAGVSTNTLAQIGYQLAIELPQSREYEYEADEIGLNILQEAGYPPVAFVNFLQQLKANGNSPEFLRTHPTNTNRIEALVAEINSPQANSDQGQSEAAYRENVLYLL